MKQIIMRPSTSKDLFSALLITLCIVSIFVLIYFLFGGSTPIDTNITAFFGAILAFSGLMTKQYFFKETIDYLSKWLYVEEVLEDIIAKTDSRDQELVTLKYELSNHKNLSATYIKYIKRELKIIPFVPILLVSLYGAALIAHGSILFRVICLSIMLYLVTYLAKATISSNNLVIEKTNIDQLLTELEELKTSLKPKSTEP